MVDLETYYVPSSAILHVYTVSDPADEKDDAVPHCTLQLLGESFETTLQPAHEFPLG